MKLVSLIEPKMVYLNEACLVDNRILFVVHLLNVWFDGNSSIVKFRSLLIETRKHCSAHAKLVSSLPLRTFYFSGWKNNHLVCNNRCAEILHGVRQSPECRQRDHDPMDPMLHRS